MGLYHQTADDIIMTQPGSLAKVSPHSQKMQNISLPGLAEYPMKQPGHSSLEAHVGIMAAAGLGAVEDTSNGSTTEHGVDESSFARHIAAATADDDSIISSVAPASPLLKAAAILGGCELHVKMTTSSAGKFSDIQLLGTIALLSSQCDPYLQPEISSHQTRCFDLLVPSSHSTVLS